MSTRDKLAQLLMVGVKSSADARAVVDTYHVGGIFIGSWTDLSMLTDGSLPDIANAGPAAAGGQRRRGGRPGVAAVVAHRHPAPSARVLAQTKTPDEVYQIGARPRAQRCAAWASPSTSRPSSTSPTPPTTP